MNILVLSRSSGLYSTQSLVNACKKRHHHVLILDHQRFDLQVNDFKLEAYYNGFLMQNIDCIIPRVGATSTQFGAAVIRHFELAGVYTVVHSESLLKARDKFHCLQILASHKIPVPKTLMANLLILPKETIQNQFSAPVVIKMKESTHGLGVILSESHSNALATLEAFHHMKQESLIQEYIQEAKGTDIRIFIVDNQIAGAMRREAALGDFRSNLHRGGKSFNVTLTKEEADMAIKAASIIGLKVAGVDILRSKKGPLVLEVNASPGLEGIETTTQIDISEKIVQMIEKDVLKNKSV
jgi:ribosomal protein S6--L-glutamate ligase